MTDLSPETNQLLASARGAEQGLSDARRSQLKAGLLTQIAALGVVTQIGAAGATSAAAATSAGGATTAGATASKLAWLSSSLVKAVSAFALLSVAGVGVYVSARSHQASVPTAGGVSSAAVALSPAPLSSSAAPTLSAVAPATSAPLPTEAAPEKAAGSSALRPSPPGASVPPSVVSAETLADETRLLRDADQALRSGNAQRALTLLDKHAARYPRGVLAPERRAERLIARCKLGQVDAKAANAYLTAHANSAFAPRIRDACAISSR